MSDINRNKQNSITSESFKYQNSIMKFSIVLLCVIFFEIMENRVEAAFIDPGWTPNQECVGGNTAHTSSFACGDSVVVSSAFGCSGCSGTHVIKKNFQSPVPFLEDACATPAPLADCRSLVGGNCAPNGGSQDCYCVTYQSAVWQQSSVPTEQQCAQLCADQVYNSPCLHQNSDMCCQYHSASQTCELHDNFQGYSSSDYKSFTWNTDYSNQPTYEPITAIGGPDPNTGPVLTINEDFVNVNNGINTVYRTKADTFDWIQNPWQDCAPLDSIELCYDPACNSPCNTPGNECYAYLTGSPNYDLIFQAPQESQTYYIVAKRSSTTISREVNVVRLTCPISPAEFPIEMLLPTKGLVELSMVKHLDYASNVMMNQDCVDVSNLAGSYSIASLSNSAVYGTLTARNLCADTSYECMIINVDSVPLQDISYKLRFTIDYNPTWSLSNSKIQTAYESLTSTFSITLGQLNTSKIKSSIPGLVSPQTLSFATKTSTDPTNRLLFPTYPQLTSFPISYHVSSSFSNLLGLTVLPQPIASSVPSYLKIDILVSYTTSVPSFYIYGVIQETTAYYTHDWVSAIFYTVDQVDVPKFECFDCSDYVIDDLYTSLNSNDYDAFDLNKVSMLSQADIVFRSSDSLNVPKQIRYYYKPFDLKLYSDQSLSPSSICALTQDKCFATVDATNMNLQFWYVPRDDQILYLKAIAQDSSDFSRKVKATINCVLSPQPINQQKLMPSYGVEAVKRTMVHQSIKQTITFHCDVLRSRLNHTTSSRITQHEKLTCSQSDTTCFHVNVTEPTAIQIMEYDMEFFIDYVSSPYRTQPWYTTDLAILNYFTLPSQINVTIGKRDWKIPSLSLGKINRGLHPVPEYNFIQNSKPQLTPANVIDLDKSQAFTLDKTIFYNISKSDCNLTTTDKVTAFSVHPSDQNKFRLEINTNQVYQETNYIYSAVKEYDKLGFTSEIYFDLTPIFLKTKCGDLYFKGEVFSVCKSFFLNEPPKFEEPEPTQILIDLEKDLCSFETSNLPERYLYKSSRVIDQEGDTIYAHCQDVPDYATVRFTYKAQIEVSLNKQLLKNQKVSGFSFSFALAFLHF